MYVHRPDELGLPDKPGVLHWVEGLQARVVVPAWDIKAFEIARVFGQP
jgi:hypothetical protein